jgi:aminoglycoside phosphotransferase (APT) family kinase protein
VSDVWYGATAEGLSRYLTEHWSRPVKVQIDGVSSAGARRRNVLVTANDGDAAHRLVATIVPNAALQIQDFMLEPDTIQLAERHGVPVAHIVGATTDPSYVEGPFFITKRVEGESIPRRIMRLIAERDLGQTMARQCGAAMSALHHAPVSEAPAAMVGVARSGPEDALEKLDLAMSDLLQPSPVFALAFRWLERHLPAAPVPTTIIHGDFRVGNMIVGEDGLRAVLDWEGTRMGDPMEDVAWISVRMWRFGNDDLEVGGFAQRDDLEAAYRDAGGDFDGERYDWWQIQGTARWGVGLSHQAMAHLDGSVPNIVMAASGRRVAEQEYDVLTFLQRRLGSRA